MKAIILVDTREQDLHILRKLDSLNIPYRRQKLNFGDYSFEWKGKSYENEIVIERKGSLTELCGNLGKGKARFEKEFKRAIPYKCKVFLMVEDGSWEKIENREYRSQFSPSEIKARINTWVNHFQLELKFVSKDGACDFILESFKKYLEIKGG